jgi:hypothetical protein
MKGPVALAWNGASTGSAGVHDEAEMAAVASAEGARNTGGLFVEVAAKEVEVRVGGLPLDGARMVEETIEEILGGSGLRIGGHWVTRVGTRSLG